MKEEKPLHEIERELHDYEGEDRIVTSHELNKEYKEMPIEPTTSTGFPTLDEWTQGLKKGDMVLISGITGEGKSSLARTMTWRFYDMGEKVCWFTFEEQPKYFMKKFPELPLFTLPRKHMRPKKGESIIEWIEKRIMESNVKHNTNIVFIDHVHYLLDMNSGQGTRAQIDGIARAVKQLAIDRNMIIN